MIFRSFCAPMLPGIKHGLVVEPRWIGRRKWRSFDWTFILGHLTNHHSLVAMGDRRCLYWTPEHSGLDRGWPTIVVEVAYSETPAKMIKDAKFWLNESSGQVSIEQWKMGTRAPVPVQKLEITRNPAPKCEKIQGRMRLSFEEIHLRPKGSDDTDFIVSHRDLEILADRVWSEQDKQGKSQKIEITRNPAPNCEKKRAK
ncbi:hypothetical protein N7465_000661 [Penicillium sp. CMV-2018d]|nr:hypothetical protein N7465_000661 [Penicillium sp. CMV-2018d]